MQSGKEVSQVKRYTVDFVTEKKQKLYYIQDDETLDLALLPTKYLKHKADANRSPNKVRGIALSICYYMNYLTHMEIDLIEVTQLGFEEQSGHFGQFLYWILTTFIAVNVVRVLLRHINKER